MITSPGHIRNFIASLRRRGSQVRLPKGPRNIETSGLPTDKITLSKAAKHKLPPSQQPNRPLYLALSGTSVIIGAAVSTVAATWTAGAVFLLPAAFCFARAFYKP